MTLNVRTTRLLVAAALVAALTTIEGTARPNGVAVPSFFAQSITRIFSGRDDARPAPTRNQSSASARLPAAVRLRESDGLGLLAQVWVNGRGPYSFALDTGAGATILSRRVAAEARVRVEAGGRGIEIGGLSKKRIGGAGRAFVERLAVGTRENALPSDGFTIVADGLPAELDGVLDPTEAFYPLGYTIDMRARTLAAFDPRTSPLRTSDAPAGGAIVRWLTEAGSRRPYVMLSAGRRALVDTGSGFGLAVNPEAARALGVAVAEGRERAGTRDLAGGEVSSRRVRPATVHVGPLALRGVPTDFLPDAHAGAPVLLGRDALRPFELTFDPVNRLIRFRPAD
ncbi:MAG TPA: aspartyl protease family protein [Pyrinomonadaceae bacterium]|nr:aspartyl protease family protein [Pyrinomonadaceae bacterium]